MNLKKRTEKKGKRKITEKNGVYSWNNTREMNIILVGTGRNNFSNKTER